MRVIAGSAGGVPLSLPKNGLRPTMDLVRGAMFSSLAEHVLGARVLDLFAGTGSIGIEALSRGAGNATLVEMDRKACTVIAENLARTRLQAKVVCMDVFRYLQTSVSIERADLIFADPPYAKQKGDQDFTRELLFHPQLPLHLAEDGILILEVGERWILPVDAPWVCIRRKKYGSTETLFLRRTAEVQSTEESNSAPLDSSAEGTE